MKYVVLEAMQCLAEYEKVIGRTVLKPTYLFVQKYGRSMETVLKETAEAFGKDKYFFFRKETGGNGHSLLDTFLVEIQKRADIGKSFDGFVLAELTGEEPEKERTAFYEYIKGCSPEIICMFTVKEEERGMALQNELEQQFPFVRVVFEECYTSTEQKNILVKAFEQGGVAMTKETENRIEAVLKNTGWKPKDHVENKLRNLANNLMYEQILEGNGKGQIDEGRLLEAVSRLTQKTEKHPIGFAPPAVRKECKTDCPQRQMEKD